MKWIALLVLTVSVFACLYISAYIVDETEQVIITQFGKPIADAQTHAGLHFKISVIQRANYFPKNLLAWDG